jgi:probable F420-dependent oxidoreductase
VSSRPRPFRFAIQSLQLGDRAALLDDARAAEAHGYEEFYSADHIGAVDPFVPLIVAAEVTSALRVGPLVLNNEFHHPVLLARAVATADRLTDGRFILGMGTGYMQSEHDAAGIELRLPGRRVERFAESLTIMRTLLDSGSAAFDGAHHHVDVEDLGVRPVQAHVPFVVGGHGRRVVTLAGQHADIFQFTGLTHGEGGTPGPGGFGIEQIRERNRWLTAAAGDRLARLERSILVQVTGVRSDVGAEYDELASRFGVDRSLVADTPFVLLGSVEQIVDKLERLREDLGVSHVVVRDAEGFAPVVEALAGR